MIPKLYLAYGLIVLGLMSTGQYRGWRLLPMLGSETRVSPRSVRDNPGSYRPAYGVWRHYTGGK